MALVVQYAYATAAMKRDRSCKTFPLALVLVPVISRTNFRWDQTFLINVIIDLSIVLKQPMFRSCDPTVEDFVGIFSRVGSASRNIYTEHSGV